MALVVALEDVLAARRVWRGRTVEAPGPVGCPAGWDELDAALPYGGWPEAALTELLVATDGVGEVELLWPALARMSANGGWIVLVSPPYMPYAPAWRAAGVRLSMLKVVEAAAKEAAWAAEQCLRSGACAAVLCWPRTADDRVLRRLQVAAEAGRACGFVFRPAQAAANPSPAALRLSIETTPARQVRVLKCRGGMPPSRPIRFPRLPVSREA